MALLMDTDFSSLKLRPELLEAVAHLGFTEMTPIQAKALPPMLSGRDVIGHARTGSGKTAAFGLAALQRLDVSLRAPQILVLCPTRELADQVADALRELARRLPNTRIVTLCGGRPGHHQRRSLQGGAHVVVGTPGRIGDHIRNGSLKLSQLRCAVLDEADRMLDMGFLDEVMHILDALPTRRQTLLFSATFPDPIAALSARIQQTPTSVGVEALHEPDTLRQTVYLCHDRKRVLTDLLADRLPASALVFCETRRDCQSISDLLRARGASALALHGDLDQRDRDDVLARFSNGSVVVLVATNVAARGLDIEDIAAVINYELPPDPEVYVHRVGRTGRAGRSGVALSLMTAAQEHRITRIEDFIEAHVPRGELPPQASSLAALEAPNRTLVIGGGRNEKLRPGDILGALTNGPDAITGGDVGDIQISERRSYVAVKRAVAAQAHRNLSKGHIKKRRLRIILLD